MSQNTSTAVMQRRVEAHDSLDDFPTPPWATRALCEWLTRNASQPLDLFSCREPAANRGHMVAPLTEYFASVEASDVHDYGVGYPVLDYLFGTLPESVDWTISNPPFRLAEQFIERAIATSRQGVAMIVRAAFLEGVGRFERLYSKSPPTYVLQFAERVVMHKGRLAPEGSTATAYAWLVWMGDSNTRLRWIAPSRKLLERATDYPVELARMTGHIGMGLTPGQAKVRHGHCDAFGPRFRASHRATACLGLSASIAIAGRSL